MPRADLTATLTLAPMDLAESATYLRHHLALVGRSDPLFADDAIARLHKGSLGLSRALNNAAIAALIAAATAGKPSSMMTAPGKPSLSSPETDVLHPTGLVADSMGPVKPLADPAAHLAGYGISCSPTP